MPTVVFLSTTAVPTATVAPTTTAAPTATVAPTTTATIPPIKHALVSMIIKFTQEKNISKPENEDLLEANLAKYYQKKKKVEAQVTVSFPTEELQ